MALIPPKPVSIIYQLEDLAGFYNAASEATQEQLDSYARGSWICGPLKDQLAAIASITGVLNKAAEGGAAYVVVPVPLSDGTKPMDPNTSFTAQLKRGEVVFANPAFEKLRLEIAG